MEVIEYICTICGEVLSLGGVKPGSWGWLEICGGAWVCRKCIPIFSLALLSLEKFARAMGKKPDE